MMTSPEEKAKQQLKNIEHALRLVLLTCNTRTCSSSSELKHEPYRLTQSFERALQIMKGFGSPEQCFNVDGTVAECGTDCQRSLAHHVIVFSEPQVTLSAIAVTIKARQTLIQFYLRRYMYISNIGSHTVQGWIIKF